MDFFDKTGQMAIGSRLRMLTDQITEDATKIYQLYGVELKAKWFPVFFVLANGEPKTITTLAKEIHHSHPSVSNIIKEMSAQGFIDERADPSDGRKNFITLSNKGYDVSNQLVEQYADVTSAINNIAKQTTHNLWQAIEEWEFLLAEKSLFKRVEEEKKHRESQEVDIVNYQPIYQHIFQSLNEAWISRYFEMEEADHKVLADPQQSIIKNGGHIFVALYKQEPIGVCALLKMSDPDYDYELVKMAVSPTAQGKNIGFLLGQAAIKKALELGANKLYLESNTMLKPAINLYQKLGFKKVVRNYTPYQRCNIQMELSLKE